MRRAPVLAVLFFVSLSVRPQTSPAVVARLGGTRAISACLALVAVAGLLRAIAPGIGLMLAATVLLGIGLGSTGTPLAMLAKERYPLRPAFASGTYGTGLAVGGGVRAALAVPIAAAAASWRVSLAALAGLAGIAFVYGCVAARVRAALARAPGSAHRAESHLTG